MPQVWALVKVWPGAQEGPGDHGDGMTESHLHQKENNIAIQQHHVGSTAYLKKKKTKKKGRKGEREGEREGEWEEGKKRRKEQKEGRQAERKNVGDR